MSLCAFAEFSQAPARLPLSLSVCAIDAQRSTIVTLSVENGALRNCVKMTMCRWCVKHMEIDTKFHSKKSEICVNYERFSGGINYLGELWSVESRLKIFYEGKGREGPREKEGARGGKRVNRIFLGYNSHDYTAHVLIRQDRSCTSVGIASVACSIFPQTRLKSIV